MATAKRFPSWIIVLGVLFLLFMWGMGIYNNLVEKEGAAQVAWSDVETQYQRRADLIPQLVETVQGAADFEQSTLLAVTEARTQWQETSDDPNATIEQQMAAANEFDSALSRLLVTVEAYPTITATENFNTFQSQLEGTENRISVARSDFNQVAGQYNITVRRFPTKLFAALFGFEGMPLFEADEGSQDAPEVDFDFGNSDEE